MNTYTTVIAATQSALAASISRYPRLRAMIKRRVQDKQFVRTVASKVMNLQVSDS